MIWVHYSEGPLSWGSTNPNTESYPNPNATNPKTNPTNPRPTNLNPKPHPTNPANSNSNHNLGIADPGNSGSVPCTLPSWQHRCWWCCLLPSNRHHQSNGDCLEGKRENYQVCSVQYCAQQLCTVQCTHIWTDLTVFWIGFCLTGPISLCLDSFLCMYCVPLYIVCMCSIVTWWGGPGGIEAWSLRLLLPSVLWHCWLGHLTRKNPSPVWPTGIMCLVWR